MQAIKTQSSELERRLDQIQRNARRLREYEFRKRVFPDLVLIAQAQRIKKQAD